MSYISSSQFVLSELLLTGDATATCCTNTNIPKKQKSLSQKRNNFSNDGRNIESVCFRFGPTRSYDNLRRRDPNQTLSQIEKPIEDDLRTCCSLSLYVNTRHLLFTIYFSHDLRLRSRTRSYCSVHIYF